MIGHYKTYTEDAPLMGKHVGRYWWGGHDPSADGRKRGYRAVLVSVDQMTFDDVIGEVT